MAVNWPGHADRLRRFVASEYSETGSGDWPSRLHSVYSELVHSGMLLTGTKFWDDSEGRFPRGVFRGEALFQGAGVDFRE